MATKPAASKPAPKAGKPAAKPELTVVPDAEGGENRATGVKLKEFVDRVVASSGAKKKDVQQVVRATMAEMSKALEAGESLILPALGRLRVVKQAAGEGGAMTLKLRKAAPGGAKADSGKDTLAEAEE